MHAILILQDLARFKIRNGYQKAENERQSHIMALPNQKGIVFIEPKRHQTMLGFGQGQSG